LWHRHKDKQILNHRKAVYEVIKQQPTSAWEFKADAQLETPQIDLAEPAKTDAVVFRKNANGRLKRGRLC
jgi:hypothetical protein